MSRHSRPGEDRWITISATLATWIVAGILQAAIIVGLVLALVW